MAYAICVPLVAVIGIFVLMSELVHVPLIVLVPLDIAVVQPVNVHPVLGIVEMLAVVP